MGVLDFRKEGKQVTFVAFEVHLRNFLILHGHCIWGFGKREQLVAIQEFQWSSTDACWIRSVEPRNEFSVTHSAERLDESIRGELVDRDVIRQSRSREKVRRVLT
jgi:hypothetical protein